MSVEATSWAWAWPGLTSTQRLVLVRIADHAAPDGSNAWPSLERLVGDTCLSRRSVQRSITDLEAMGALEVDYKAGPHGVNRYRVHRFDGATVSTSPPVDNPPDSATPTPCHRDTVPPATRDVVTDDTERGHCGTQSIINHPEPSSLRAPSSTTRPGDEDEEEVDPVHDVLRHVARIRMDAATLRGTRIANRVAWQATVVARIDQATRTRAAELIATYPTARPSQIAAYLEGEHRSLALVPRAS